MLKHLPNFKTVLLFVNRMTKVEKKSLNKSCEKMGP